MRMKYSKIEQLNTYLRNTFPPRNKAKVTSNLKDKKVYFLSKIKLSVKELKKVCTIVQDVKEADIIVYSNSSIHKITIYYTLPSGFYSKSKVDQQDTECNIYGNIDFIQNLCKSHSVKSYEFIHVNNVLVDLSPLTELELTDDVRDKIIQLVQSDESSIFNLGWDLIWQYDIVKYKNQIAIIYCNCSTLIKRRVKKNGTEYYFQLWKKQFKNL